MSNKQLGRVGGKTFDQFPPWEGRGVPTRDTCDPTNPRQAFLWMFTAMPGLQGAPLILPPEYWEMQSWRMWVLGARPTEEPQLKWRPPANMANPWNATGAWVPLDAPAPPRKTLKDVVGELGQADRADLANVMLQKLGLDAETTPPTPDGKYRVADLAKRLDQRTDDVIAMLARFGMTNVKPSSLVGRDVADRIINHLGL